MMKAFRKQDQVLLLKVRDEDRGCVARSPLVEAFKRAGAHAYADERNRLTIAFCISTLYIGAREITLKRFPHANYRECLRELAKDLLHYQGSMHSKALSA